MPAYTQNILSFLVGVGLTSIVFISLFDDQPIDAYSEQQVQSNTPSLPNQTQAYTQDQTSQPQSAVASSEANSASSLSAIQNWTQLLGEQLGEEYDIAIYYLSPEDAALEIDQDQQLLEQVLASIKTLQVGDQRTFLIRALHSGSNVTRLTAIDSLQTSTRPMDRADSANLIVSLDNRYDREAYMQQILQNETHQTVLQRAVGVLNSEDTKELAASSFNDLVHLVDTTQDIETKGLAMRAMLKADPSASALMSRVDNMLASNDQTVMQQGLTVLKLQINDYGIALNPNQQAAIESNLHSVANDNQQSVENRLSALTTLKVLKDYY